MVHAHKIMHGEIAHMYKHMLYIYVHLRLFIPLFVHYGEVSICNYPVDQISCSGLSENWVFHTMAIRK